MNPPVTRARSLWPYGLIVFFAVFISWIAIFITIAVSNSSELVGADYYEREIRYQERIDSLNRTAATSGLRVEFDPALPAIHVRLPDGHAGGDVTGRFTLYRPSNGALDHTLKLTPDAAGRQTLPLRDLAPGAWKLEAEWLFRGESYFTQTNFVVVAR